MEFLRFAPAFLVINYYYTIHTLIVFEITLIKNYIFYTFPPPISVKFTVVLVFLVSWDLHYILHSTSKSNSRLIPCTGRC